MKWVHPIDHPAIVLVCWGQSAGEVTPGQHTRRWARKPWKKVLFIASKPIEAIPAKPRQRGALAKLHTVTAKEST